MLVAFSIRRINDNLKQMKKIYILTFSIILLILAGCAPLPTETQIPLSSPTSEPNLDSQTNSAWLPQEDVILFISERGGKKELFYMNTDGSQVEKISLPDLPENSLFERPTWSNALKKFFMGVSNGPNGDIYSFDFDGSNLTNLTNTVDQYEGNPLPSANGEYVLYVLEELDLDIGIMLPNGNNPTNLTLLYTTDSAPIWTNNDQQIIFTSNRPGTPSIFIMDIDGSNVRNISLGTGVDAWPNLSPVEALMSFQSDRAGALDIFLLNLDTNEITNLTNTENIREYQPIFSPDGTKILYTLEEDNKFDLYLMDIDGTQKERITTTPDQREFGAQWSANGSQIIFTGITNDQLEIFSYNTETKEITNLSNNPANDYAPLWIHFQE